MGWKDNFRSQVGEGKGSYEGAFSEKRYHYGGHGVPMKRGKSGNIGYFNCPVCSSVNTSTLRNPKRDKILLREKPHICHNCGAKFRGD